MATRTWLIDFLEELETLVPPVEGGGHSVKVDKGRLKLLIFRPGDSLYRSFYLDEEDFVMPPASAAALVESLLPPILPKASVDVVETSAP